jgi:hypothetical protein
MQLSKFKRILFSLAAGGLLLAGLFVLLHSMSQVARADPGDLFVTPGGSGDCSQASPCELASALGAAAGGDSIYMATGTYTGTGSAVITISQSINLYGGWDGTTTTPPVLDPVAYPSTLDGEGLRRVVYVSGPVTTTLQGLTIANGQIISTTGVTPWDGAGLYAQDAALTLRHTNFYSNVVDVFDVADSYAYGGGAMVVGGTLQVYTSTFQANGIWAKNSSNGGGLSISNTLTATVAGSQFVDNDAWNGSGVYFLNMATSHSPFTLRDSTFVDNGNGNSPGAAYGGYSGAIEVINAQARIQGNTFSGSWAGNDYGALGIFNSGLFLVGNVISGNQSGRTSGLHLSGVSPFTVTNNIIVNNGSVLSAYPGVRVTGGSGQFLHNTIARNESDYGVEVDSGASITLTNTILVSHTVGITVSAGSAAALEGTLWGSGAWANGSDWGGAGSIVTGTIDLHGDPAFVNPAAGNYHIGPASAAIDAGVDAGVSDDIDGDPRPLDSGFDIGADEFSQPRNLYLPLVMKN